MRRAAGPAQERQHEPCCRPSAGATALLTTFTMTPNQPPIHLTAKGTMSIVGAHRRVFSPARGSQTNNPLSATQEPPTTNTHSDPPNHTATPYDEAIEQDLLVHTATQLSDSDGGHSDPRSGSRVTRTLRTPRTTRATRTTNTYDSLPLV